MMTFRAYAERPPVAPANWPVALTQHSGQVMSSKYLVLETHGEFPFFSHCISIFYDLSGLLQLLNTAECH